MASLAMQLEPRISVGRLKHGKRTAPEDNDDANAPQNSRTRSGDVTFFYWSETLDEVAAEQRIADQVGQRNEKNLRSFVA